MDIFQIRYFLELKKHEHMSVTADLLNISQPALSRSIAALEAELGIQLFDRLGKRIKLNRNGEEFAKYAEKALRFLDYGVDAAKKVHYEITGQITILCYAYAPVFHPCLAAYAKLNPYVHFMVSQFALGERLKHAESPDFILCSSSGALPFSQEQFWISEPLTQEDYLLAASASLLPPQPGRTSLPLAELKNYPFITLTHNSIFYRDITFLLCQNAGFFTKSPIQTDSYDAQLDLVRQGLGLAILPASYTRCLKFPDSDLVFYSLENCPYRHTLSLLRQRKALMTEAALDFWDFVLDYYGRSPDSRD